MLNAHHFDILKDDFNFNQAIHPNTIFKIKLYSNFIIDSIFIDSISSKHFNDICTSIHLDPLTVFSFENISDTLYFIFICQNLCSVVKIDNEERLQTFLNSIEKIMMIASKEQDMITLKKYVDNPRFSFPNEDESLDSFYDAKKLREHYYKINKLTFDDNITVSSYLFLSSLSLFSFFLRRNYFPTSSFIDPSFFYPPNLQGVQSNAQNEKKIPKLQDSEFIKIRIIGYGSNSVVTLVVHKTSGFLFALKTVLNKKSYKNEYKCFEKNIHSRIIRCYGVISQGVNKAFILDFMCNGSLEDKVITDPSTKSVIIYQILYALDYLHLNGLIHCDIKLSSILLNRDFDAYLAGFSNLHDLVTIREKTINIGSFPFMAPEIIAGSNKYSFQADLYSFGVLIYEFTTGEKPYNGITLLNAIQKGAIGDVDHLRAVEGPITRLFELCTSADECGRSASFILRKLFEMDYLFYANSDEEIVTKFINKLKSEEIENKIDHKDDEKDQEKISVDSDQRDDFKFILSNAQNGNSNAQYILGLMYSNGWIVEKNDMNAFKWFVKAADQNNAFALYEVGLYYHKKANQIEMQFDYAKAFDMYKKAADQGLSDAENNIGELYVEGHLSPSKEYESNFAQAYEYFKKAADKGNHRSQCNLGKLLLTDKSGKIDIEKSIEYLKLAVSQGNSEAEVCLAKIYSDGKILQNDDHMAAYLYRKAAYHKRTDAMIEYGKRLLEGKGVQINKNEGENWIKEAEKIEKENLLMS